MVPKLYPCGLYNSYVEQIFALCILNYRLSLVILFLWDFSVLYFDLGPLAQEIFLDEYFFVIRKPEEKTS